MPLASLIYPIKNRADLFAYTLNNLSQTRLAPSDVEIVVIDQSSSDGLVDLLQSYAKYFTIHYYNVDISRYTMYPLPQKGFCNPAYFINLGIRKSSGQYVILTSPEVCPQYDILGELRDTGDGQTILQARTEEAKADNGRLITGVVGLTGLRELTTREALMGAYPAYYYFNAYPREQIVALGGIEEAYMSGFATEDDDFCDVVAAHKLPFKFFKGGKCCHIMHPLNKWAYTYEWYLNRDLLQRRRDELRSHPDRVNNIGKEWGSDECLISRKRMVSNDLS